MLRSDFMEKIYNNVVELRGNSPLIRLNSINIGYGEIVVKKESSNPGGSIKDRPAFAMIEEGEKKGIINKDTVIIEPTSGNTGVGLAMVCAIKGYRLILTMPDTMSIERRNLLKAYGADIILTDGKKGMKGSIDKVEELKKEYSNHFVPGQFINPVNPRIHKETTVKEIIKDTDGKIDILVCGVGTGGTITGIGEGLKEFNNNITVVAVEPNNSPVISGGNAGAHKIQGIGAGFIPTILNTDIIDEIIKIEDNNAIETMVKMAKEEGILVGISAGAAVSAALELSSRKENKGKRIVVILPDTGERYLSLGHF
jgi:cysteine synthase A